MKELITVASAFLIVVGLALFMFVSNQGHSTAVKKSQEIMKLYENQQAEIEKLNTELEGLKLHTEMVDSLYHKKLSNEQ